MKTKYLILGAGISGLSFASKVDDYIILEKESRAGGYCKTTKKDGYTWDYAGHFYHFKTPEIKNEIMSFFKDEDIVNKEKNTKIVFKNDLIDYPFQMNIHQLPKDDFISCLYDLYTKVEKKKYNNFLDMLYGKFGESITNFFLKPYNEKLYSCDLKTLDTEAMGRFFPYANLDSIINNMKNGKNESYNSTFMYPKNGAEAVIEIINKKVNQNNIYFNQSIEKIDIDKKIVYTNNMEIHYEYLVNTIPLNRFLLLTNNKKYNKLSSEASYNKVLVFNMGFSKESKFNKEHWLYIPDKNINFYRIGFYNNILNEKKLSVYIEIGFSKDDVIDDVVVEKEFKKTIEGLKRLNIIDKDNKLVSYETIIMDPAYVHITTDFEKKKEKVLNELSEKNVYSIGRYGKWTYCSMEDCMIDAYDLAKEIK